MQTDIQYLKEYVKQRPDNQMAWYLLGKQYELQEKHGKAAYCFLQAGEVYEAFEKKPLPIAAEADERDLTASGTPRRQFLLALSKWLRRTAVIVLFLSLLYIPGYPSVDLATSGDPAEESVALDTDVPQDNAPVEPESETVSELLVVQAKATTDRRWINWVTEPEYVLSAIWGGAGQLDTIYYNQSQCECIPGDIRQAALQFADWQRQHEELLVLFSSLAYFEQEHGYVPQDKKELAAPYPHNFLSGLTPLMLEERDLEKELSISWLSPPKLSDEIKDQFVTQRKDWPSLDSKLNQPLEIIIDKENHRLGLISGSVLLRNYPVGLGGDLTPEGEFNISEKVHSPNGRTDGDYGSRGMALSDTLYAIHGTNAPHSIGQDESLGCIRMHNEDVEELFAMVPLGTKVTITKNALPTEILHGEERFELPSWADETNPKKIYKWLN